MNQGHGYLTEPIKEEDWIFGGQVTELKGTVAVPNGDWTPWLPSEERQAPDYETNACASFGTLNALETIERQRGTVRNYSDRFVAKGSGTDPARGNTPHAVAEFIRKKGLVSETDWPYEAETVQEFYAMLPQRLYELAFSFLQRCEFKHEYVITSPEMLKEALKYSPLGISVNLWPTDDGIYYKPEGQRDNHWVTLVGYQDKKHWVVFDSYAPFVKFIRWNTAFEVAKRYHLGPPTQQSIMTLIIEQMTSLIALLREQLRQKLGLWKYPHYAGSA